MSVKQEYNKVCMGCKNKCKQFAWVELEWCNKYESKDGNKKGFDKKKNPSK